MLEIIPQKEAINSAVAIHSVRFLVLHGSYATKTAHAESDVDVAVFFEPGAPALASMSAYGELCQALTEALGVGMRNLDVVILNTANILLRYEVTSKGILLYGNCNAYDQYCAFAFRDYVDAKDLFQLEHELIENRQRFLAQAMTAR